MPTLDVVSLAIVARIPITHSQVPFSQTAAAHSAPGKDRSGTDSF
jgi:hypothetical protein